jgi:hypothetical protein
MLIKLQLDLGSLIHSTTTEVTTLLVQIDMDIGLIFKNMVWVKMLIPLSAQKTKRLVNSTEMLHIQLEDMVSDFSIK